MATRKTQPYRKGARPPGAALTAMLRGRSLYGANPMDAQRRNAKLLTRGAKAKKRPDRPDRPERPPR